MKRLAIAAIIVASAMSASAQSVQRFNATKANEYGLTYTLPFTAIEVTLEVEITRKTPGEFYKYASKYLNVNDPIMAPSVSASVKSAYISTMGVPDPERRYLITLKNDHQPFILLDTDNLPLAINTDRIAEADDSDMPVAVPPSATPLDHPMASRVFTQEMIQSHSSAKRAQLAAEQIYALRQSRNDLITGQADRMPPDGQALKIVLDNIDAQEAALVAMFVGTTSTETVVGTAEVLPDSDLVNKVIARISPTDGIVSIGDLQGAPVYINLHITSEGELPVNDKGETLPFPKGGVAYCIPGQAYVSISFDGKVIAEKTVDMAQFGVVYGMKPDNFSSKSPIYAIFDQATGAIIETGAAQLKK